MKSLTSCTSRDINLFKTILRAAVRTPSRMPLKPQESEDLAINNTPCQQEAAKRSMPDPQPLPSSLLKKKWRNDRVIMLPFCELVTNF
jgi:hypothetical protein